MVKHFCAEPGKRLHLPSGDCHVLLDSGAFGDVRRGRITFQEALQRQLDYEERCAFVSERLVSYDMLIDEQLQGDRQIKSRWPRENGWQAVETTIAAAEFLVSRRRELAPRQLVLSCQGVTVEQYEACMEAILEIAEPQDCIGLGGWCIVGQRRELASLFWQAMDTVLPMIAAKGIKDVHIFGLAWVAIMKEWAVKCRDLGLRASNDTTRFFFELSRGLALDVLSGKSLWVRLDAGRLTPCYSDMLRTKRNLCLDHELAIQNIETAYEFFQHIEDWQPAGALL
jgi:hypothetical protein